MSAVHSTPVLKPYEVQVESFESKSIAVSKDTRLDFKVSVDGVNI